jgi:hypothetical protein
MKFQLNIGILSAASRGVMNVAKSETRKEELVKFYEKHSRKI